MNENSLLALLARLCGDISMNDNQDPNEILALQQAVASAIINEPALSLSNSFQFEQLDNFSTRHLNTTDLQHLNNVLQPRALDRPDCGVVGSAESRRRVCTAGAVLPAGTVGICDRGLRGTRRDYRAAARRSAPRA